MSARNAQAACALLLAALACSETPSHPPVARIKPSPNYIAKDDSFITTVMLSGKASADPFDDPEGRAPLTYRWVLPVDAQIQSGSITAAELSVKLSGAEPTPISLTVTDETGQSATATTMIGVVIPR